MTPVAALEKFFSCHPRCSSILVAYSGGMDSHVLLHAIARVDHKSSIKIVAVHVDHNLNAASGKWSKHCADIAAELGVGYLALEVDAAAQKGCSTEAVARNLRYEALAKIMTAGDLLLTAQHLDDQAETLLLQLFRGAGPKGLSGMPIYKKFASGFLGRPFLDLTCQDIKEYALANNLDWIEDDSNFNIDIRRNFLRHKIMPKLNKYWPALAKTISRSAEHAADAEFLLDNYMTDVLTDIEGSKLGTISIKKLSLLDEVLQKRVVRHWLGESGFTMPATKKLAKILTDVVNARPDAMPLVAWPGAEIRRYRDDLYAMLPVQNHDINWSAMWQVKDDLVLPYGAVLTRDVALAHGLDPTVNTVKVTFRLGGEKCLMIKRKGRRALKNIFQELGIPPWLRSRAPLLAVNGEIVAVVNPDSCNLIMEDKKL